MQTKSFLMSAAIFFLIPVKRFFFICHRSTKAIAKVKKNIILIKIKQVDYTIADPIAS